LNFYDDQSHVRIYSTRELTQLFAQHGFKVLKGGLRRNIYFMAAAPFRIVKHWITGKKLIGNIFWDILGFAEYIWACKR
ncbi:MAG TPA: hypothetical protein VG890_07270, partial [Puia sp.]|nr:hypothetical protein [Puia sp.]